MRILAVWLALICFMPSALAEEPWGESVRYDVGMRVQCIEALDENHIAVGGWIRGASTAVLRCMNTQGHEVWSVALAEANASLISDLAVLDDGKLVMIQDNEQPKSSEPYSHVKRNIILVKDGQILSVYPLDPGAPPIPPAVFRADDGYFVFYGERMGKDKHGGTFYATALEWRDLNGNLQRKQVFEDQEISLYGVASVADGYLFYGSEEDQKTGDRNTMALLMKLDKSGNVIWRTTVPGERWKHISSLTPSSEGHLFAVGGHVLQPTQKEEFPTRGIRMGFSPDGQLLWEEDHTEGDPAYSMGSVYATQEGFIALVSDDRFLSPGYLALLDASGNVLTQWPLERHADPMHASLTDVGHSLKSVHDAMWQWGEAYKASMQKD